MADAVGVTRRRAPGWIRGALGARLDRWVATGPAPSGDYRVLVIHEFPNQTRGTQVLLDTVVGAR